MKQLIIANVSQDNHVAGCSSQRLEIQFNKFLPKVEHGLGVKQKLRRHFSSGGGSEVSDFLGGATKKRRSF